MSTRAKATLVLSDDRDKLTFKFTENENPLERAFHVEAYHVANGEPFYDDGHDFGTYETCFEFAKRKAPRLVPLLELLVGDIEDGSYIKADLSLVCSVGSGAILHLRSHRNERFKWYFASIQGKSETRETAFLGVVKETLEEYGPLYASGLMTDDEFAAIHKVFRFITEKP